MQVNIKYQTIIAIVVFVENATCIKKYFEIVCCLSCLHASIYIYRYSCAY